MGDKHTPEHLAKAKRIVAQIEAKIAGAIGPLEREMQIMQWAPEYRAIVWEAVARKAMEKALEAHRG